MLPKDAIENGFTSFRATFRVEMNVKGKIIDAKEARKFTHTHNDKVYQLDGPSNLKYGVESVIAELLLNMPAWEPATVRDTPVKYSFKIELKYGFPNNDTTFFDAEGKETDRLSKASYYEIEKNDTLKKGKSTSYTYFRSGQLRSELNYFGGDLEGRLRTYWPNGQLKRNDAYHDGNLISGAIYNSKGEKLEYYNYEIQAQFPGGTTALGRYLKSNIVYPKTARRQGISGMVFLKFMVTADGSIKDIFIEKGVSYTIDDEAIRVVEQMPKWIPASRDGENIKCYFRIPINFRIG